MVQSLQELEDVVNCRNPILAFWTARPTAHQYRPPPCLQHVVECPKTPAPLRLERPASRDLRGRGAVGF
eukprot:7843531-Pyramimonas_sp.AAC.1